MLLAVAASALAACGGNNLDGGTRHAFFVRGALAPPPHSNDTAGCVYTADPSAASLLAGRVDVGVTDSYQLTVLAQGTDATVSTSITGAHVALKSAAGDMIREFDLVTTGFIPPGGSAAASVIVVDAPARDLLLPMLPYRTVSETLVADVTLRGRDAAGGPEVTSPVFSFPFQACNGCLVDFSAGNDPTARIQPNCLRPMDPAAHVPCVIGQEEAVPCQLCVGTRPVCDPATP